MHSSRRLSQSWHAHIRWCLRSVWCLPSVKVDVRLPESTLTFQTNACAVSVCAFLWLSIVTRILRKMCFFLYSSKNSSVVCWSLATRASWSLCISQTVENCCSMTNLTKSLWSGVRSVLLAYLYDPGIISMAWNCCMMGNVRLWRDSLRQLDRQRFESVAFLLNLI